MKEKNTKYQKRLTIEEITFILDNSHLLTATELANKFKVSSSTIRQILSKNNIQPKIRIIDRSRPCSICSTVFTPKSDDGVKKDKYIYCSSICSNAGRTNARRLGKYTKEQLNQIIELKKNNITNSEIVSITGVNLNTVKSLIKENSLFLTKKQRIANSSTGKIKSELNKRENITTDHEKKLHLIKKSIENGEGTVSGLSEKHRLNAPSVALSFHLRGWSDLIGTSASTPEIELCDFIKQILPKTEVFHNKKNIIYPLELDIAIPDKKIAIEFNGLYWHCDKNKENNYHYNKMNKVNEKGYRLISIFEDEWKNRKFQVKSFLKSVLASSDNRVYARKCTISVISKELSDKFINKYHIQGKAISTVSFGLFYNEELVGVMTGSKHHRDNTSNTLVLSRLAFKDDWTIVGGAGKLLSELLVFAVQNNYKKLVSWSDNRWSQGNVYNKLGFILEENMKPDYSYFENKGIFRSSKQSNTKEKLLKKGGIGKTEKEMAISLGYARIYDCGKKRWIMNL